MRAIGYCRCSTSEQATDGVTLATQKGKLYAYAALYDIELIEVIEDAGQSAKTLQRPGLERALSLLKSSKAEGLLVAKLDRLSRSVGDWDDLIEDYFGERAGKHLFSVGDAIDTRTAAGRLVLNILMSVAQWEREAIGERTRDALQHKIRNGERCGKIRFGYELGPDGRTLIENATEQEAIRLMIELRNQRFTLTAIAEELSRRGIATKERKAAWKPFTVSQILQRIA